jgi:23S rRNA-/tRNA-specific pseudouridylate synthase
MEIRIIKDNEGIRMDKILRKVFGIPQSIIQSLARKKKILVNNIPIECAMLLSG